MARCPRWRCRAKRWPMRRCCRKPIRPPWRSATRPMRRRSTRRSIRNTQRARIARPACCTRARRARLRARAARSPASRCRRRAGAARSRKWADARRGIVQCRNVAKTAQRPPSDDGGRFLCLKSVPSLSTLAAHQRAAATLRAAPADTANLRERGTHGDDCELNENGAARACAEPARGGGGRDRQRARVVRLHGVRLHDGRDRRAVLSDVQRVLVAAAHHRDVWRRVLHAPDRRHRVRPLCGPRGPQGRAFARDPADDGRHLPARDRTAVRGDRHRRSAADRARTPAARLLRRRGIRQRDRVADRSRAVLETRLLRQLADGEPGRRAADRRAGRRSRHARAVARRTAQLGLARAVHPRARDRPDRVLHPPSSRGFRSISPCAAKRAACDARRSVHAPPARGAVRTRLGDCVDGDHLRADQLSADLRGEAAEAAVCGVVLCGDRRQPAADDAVAGRGRMVGPHRPQGAVAVVARADARADVSAVRMARRGAEHRPADRGAGHPVGDARRLLRAVRRDDRRAVSGQRALDRAVDRVQRRGDAVRRLRPVHRHVADQGDGHAARADLLRDGGARAVDRRGRVRAGAQRGSRRAGLTDCARYCMRCIVSENVTMHANPRKIRGQPA
ncbi:hypothetical protein BLAT2472_120042 [Burkholderia latens]